MMARATTARRKSSAAGPSSLTNAVTSQEDIRMRALPIFTVVMERPRVGGVAMSCSQICSRQASKSMVLAGSAFGAGADERALAGGLTGSSSSSAGALIGGLADGAAARAGGGGGGGGRGGRILAKCSGGFSTSLLRFIQFSKVFLSVRFV